MPGYDDFDDRRIKHLELIQAVIARLGSNGFLIKGWALTVAGVFFGFALESGNWLLGWASVMMTLVFWGLDAYFLKSERLFRELYRRVSELDPTIAPFFMGATEDDFVERPMPGLVDHWAAFWSWTLRAFYGSIIAIGGFVVIAVLITGAGASPSSSPPSPALESVELSP